jgi:hypothetical protein
MNRRLPIFLFLLLLSSTSSALAQNGFQFRDWKPSLNDGAAVKPKRDCGALVSLTSYEFSIETAALVPASGDLPEYCHVTGQILPEVRFELTMPSSWNNRFYMFGNGGYAFDARARQRSQYGAQGRLRRRTDQHRSRRR